MKTVLIELIENFYHKKFPPLTTRTLHFPVAKDTATVITGMRRTGKTTLCYQRMQELLDSGVAKNRLLYLNFEDERLFGFTLKNCQEIIEAYFQLYPNNRGQLCYFFFDEMQNIANWERFIRRLIDTEKVQITITGSSSKMLTTEIGTAMRGRSLSTEVFPFSFAEFLRYHKIYAEIPQIGGDDLRYKAMNALKKYFLHGGFPEVQRDMPEDAILRLQEYVNVVTSRDIIERYQLHSNLQALKHLVNAVFYAPAQKFSVNNFSKQLKQLSIANSKEMLQQYIDYFCDAYLFYKVPLQSDSMARRRVNPDKLYLIDVGLIRAMVYKTSADNGALFENLVFLALRRKNYVITYVSTPKENYEVDFYAVDRRGNKGILVQACYTIADAETCERECRALLAAKKMLSCKKCYIVTWDEERDLAHGIKVIPMWKFLLDRF